MLLIVLPPRLKLFAKLPGVRPAFGSARPHRITSARSVGSLKPSPSDKEVSIRTFLPNAPKFVSKAGSDAFSDRYWGNFEICEYGVVEKMIVFLSGWDGSLHKVKYMANWFSTVDMLTTLMQLSVF